MEDSICQLWLRLLLLPVWEEKRREEMEADWLRAQQGFRNRRRRWRVRPYRAGGCLLRASGCDHLKDRRNDFGTESDSACSNSFRKEESSSCEISDNETSVKPREKPMDKGLSREAGIRWSSPSIIARLMGLDEQPSVQVVHKQKKPINGSFRKLSAVGLQEKHFTRAERLRQMSTPEHQEFKDVDRVMEMLEVERGKRKLVHEVLPSLKQHKLNVSKQYYPDVSFVGQNVMNVMNFSNDASLKISKESSNGLGIHDFSEHHFPRVFQEPNFLFRKYFHELKWLTASHLTSKKSVFKPSYGARIGSDEVCCPFKKKTDNFTRKNHIVVLKPSIDKDRRKIHRRTPENIKFTRKQLTTLTGFLDTHIGGRDWLNFSNNVEDFGCKTKHSKEIDREIMEQPRKSVSGSKEHVPILGLNKFSSEDRSCIMPGMNNLCNSEGSSNHFNDWNSHHRSTLVSSTEFIQRKARKNFSGKWKVTCHSKEAGDYGKGSNTLAETLALPDMEAQETAFSLPVVHSVLNEKSSRTDVSRSSWEDGFFINLPKSISVPVPSTTSGSQNLRSFHQVGDEHLCAFNDVLKLRPKRYNQRGSSSVISIKSSNHKLYSDIGGEDDNLPSQKILINLEKATEGVLVKTTAERNSKLLSVPNSVNADVLMVTNEEQPQLSVNNIILKNPKVSSGNLKQASLEHLQVDRELLTPIRMKQEVQPCTDSVIEPPLREDDSRCSAKLTGDLLDHHIKALTTESADSCAEESEVLTLRNEENREECESLPQTGYLEEEFMDEEERDYTYLLDILIVSGVHSAKQDRLHNACYSPEYPVNPSLFETIEKKYHKLVAWSQSERKLMFDLTNFILADILAPCTDLHPWVNPTRKIGPMWGSEGLVEKTWQMLVRKRIELNVGNAEDKVLDLKWLDLRDNIDEMGKEIERMLKEELLEELVAELITE